MEKEKKKIEEFDYIRRIQELQHEKEVLLQTIKILMEEQ